MARYLSLVSGVRKWLSAISSTAGSGDADKLIATDSNGFADYSLIKGSAGFFQLGTGGAGVRSNSGVIETRDPTNASAAALNASDLRIGGQSIRSLGYTGGYNIPDPGIFTGMYLAKLPVQNLRIVRASSSTFSVTYSDGGASLSVPESSQFIHYPYLNFGFSAQSLSTAKFSGSPSPGAGQTWYVFVMRSDSDGSLSCKVDTSIVAVNRPSGYGYRLIGFLTTDAAGDIYQVHQYSSVTRDQCIVYNSADQSITNNTLTALTFNLEYSDTNGMHSTVSNTSRITAQKDGWYSCSLNAHWATATAAGTRSIYIRVNGSLVLTAVRDAVPTNVGVVQQETTKDSWYFNSGDYIEAMVIHTNGGSALSILAIDNTFPSFSMRLLD